MPTSRSTGDSSVVESSTERDQPDYSSIALPSKPPSEYTYNQRRAELLQLVEQAGHPGAINQAELAERYEVSQQQISKDLDRLDEYVRERISRRRDLKVGSALDRALRGALEDEEWKTAAKIAKMFDEYQQGRVETLEFRRRLDQLEDIAEAEENAPW